MVASEQFLFDKFNTARSPFFVETSTTPQILWESSLRSLSKAGPESSPAFDENGNMYFGSHDGCFYSYDKNGTFRWMYNVGAQIYSSPIICGNRVSVASGNGYLLCFSVVGELLWVYDISKNYRSLKVRIKKNLINYLNVILRFGLSGYQLSLWNRLSWASPKMIGNVIYITGCGSGVHAVNIETGRKLWERELGKPNQHLAGVAIGKEGEVIAVAQKKWIYSLTQENEVRWKRRLKKGYDNWSTPSIDPETGDIYVASSCGETRSILYSFTKEGDIRWTLPIKGAIRGSVAISYENYVVLVTLRGYMYFVGKADGNIIRETLISKATRALWTTPTIDKNGNILFTIKESSKDGAIICFNKKGERLWKVCGIGKTLSVPIIDEMGRVYIGSWRGSIICLK